MDTDNFDAIAVVNFKSDNILKVMEEQITVISVD